jgi:hypothetical protein
VSRNIEKSDTLFTKRLDGIEESVNELFRKTGRPGAESGRRWLRAQGRVSISGPSLRLSDRLGGWACESSCFSNESRPQ